MKTKVLIMALATLLFSSCWKSNFADRPPKEWNNDYVDPKYIWDHRNSLAMGDTVMVWGWLADGEGEDGFSIVDDTNFIWDGNYLSNCHYASNCDCDWVYCFVPTRKEDVIFEPINTEK